MLPLPVDREVNVQRGSLPAASPVIVAFAPTVKVAMRVPVAIVPFPVLPRVASSIQLALFCTVPGEAIIEMSGSALPTTVREVWELLLVGAASPCKAAVALV